MALTRVSRHIIDEPFNPTTVSATDVTATNINASGIGTVGTLRVTGDLTVEGTTTTLDSIITEVDRLEVSANSTVAAGIITQTGSGDGLLVLGGNVGFGTDSPDRPLHIFDDTNDTNVKIEATAAGKDARLELIANSTGVSQIRLGDEASANPGTITYDHSDNSLSFRTNGTSDRLTITSDGKVGINRTPSHKLEILNGSDAPNIVMVRGADATSEYAGMGVDGGNAIITGGSAGNHNVGIVFRTAASGTEVEKFRIASDGKVGIGTDNPNYLLDAYKSTGTDQDVFSVRGQTSAFLVQCSDLSAANPEWRLRTFSLEDLVFSPGGTGAAGEKVRIKASNGNVGIGTDTPEARLHTYGGDAILENQGGISVKLRRDDTSTAANRLIGAIEFQGNDSNGTYETGAIIRAFSDIAHGTGDKPSRLEFHTTPDNSATPVERLRITSDGNIGLAGQTNPADSLHIGDFATVGYELKFSRNAVQFRRAGNSFIDQKDDAGNIVFRTTSNNTERLRITSDGKVRVPDNGKFVAGAGDDLQIHHNNSNSIIEHNGTGNLYIQTTGDNEDLYLQAADNVLIRPQGSEDGIRVIGNGAVELYYNNDKKLETTTTGAKVTGALEVTQEYPSIRPTLDLNFAATKTLDRRITFTRDSVGTYVDDMGIIKYASNNVPRFDHDPITHESLGLLIEESRTNLLINSDLRSPVSTTNVSLADFGFDPANTVDPSGLPTTSAPDGRPASKLVFANGHTRNAGANTYRAGFFYSHGSGVDRLISVFVKPAEWTGFEVRYGNQGSNRYFRYFDLTGAGNCSHSDCTIALISNGWYRITLPNNNQNRLSFIPSTSYQSSSTGDGTSGIYIWGAQLETGSFVTSYIPTSGSTVTRAQDSAKITGTNLTDFYNQPEGTIFADYKVIQSEPEIMYLSNNTASKRIGLYEAGSSQTRFLIGDSGTQADTTDSTGTTVGDNIKSAGAYKLNDIVAAKNGAISSTDSSATIPDGIDRAYIGGYFNGTAEGVLGLRRLSYYNKRLSNAQLQGLTQQ